MKGIMNLILHRYILFWYMPTEYFISTLADMIIMLQIR